MSLQKLTIKNMASFVSDLITGLYSGTLQYDENLITEDSIWLGAYRGQVLKGRDAISVAMAKKELVGQAILGPIYTKTIVLGKKHCETISEFDRTLILDNGQQSMGHVRIHATWVKRVRWQIAVTSVQSLMVRDDYPQVFALHTPLTPPSEQKLMLREKGTDNTIFIQPSMIEWVENDSHYSTIHMKDKVITVGIELRDLYRRCEGTLILCHASYLINPMMVTSIKRFSLTLQSGVILPIPEKRYTSVKRQLLEMTKGK